MTTTAGSSGAGSPVGESSLMAETAIRFANGLWAIPEVERYWVRHEIGTVQLWILLSRSSPEVRYRVYDLERELLLGLGDAPFEVFVYGRDEVDPANLPAGDVSYERP